MPDINNFTLKELMENVQEQENLQRIEDDTDRFNVYHGKLKDLVLKAMRQEFKKQDTIDALKDRIIPVNIVQKIVDKLAGLYIQSPKRQSKDDDPGDNELVDFYEKALRMDREGKNANRLFKLHKHTLWEPYLNSKGVPNLRTIPSQAYTPIGLDPLQPNKPSIIVKKLKDDHDKHKQRFAVWSDEQFVVVNGEGNVDAVKMQDLNNPEGINPFGRLPFVYISEADDSHILPISDDDLITMQVVICILLTDLAFASKFGLWSVVVAKGVQPNQNFDWNPNSIIKLPQGVDLETIKPQLDIQEGLGFIETLIGLLLTTKNLSVGDISGSIQASNPASGIAKIIDRAETTEDRLDQEQTFREAEMELWDLFAHTMLPFWVQTGEINDEFVGRFSDDFVLSIKYADPKPPVSDQDVVDLEIKKLNNQLTTKSAALRQVHPEKDVGEVEMLEADIKEESRQAASVLNNSLGGNGEDSQN